MTVIILFLHSLFWKLSNKIMGQWRRNRICSTIAQS